MLRVGHGASAPARWARIWTSRRRCCPLRAWTKRRRREHYPHRKGRRLLGPILVPGGDGPRGSAERPDDGALVCWDGLHALDDAWSASGALKAATSPFWLAPSHVTTHRRPRTLARHATTGTSSRSASTRLTTPGEHGREVTHRMRDLRNRVAAATPPRPADPSPRRKGSPSCVMDGPSDDVEKQLGREDRRRSGMVVVGRDLHQVDPDDRIPGDQNGK